MSTFLLALGLIACAMLAMSIGVLCGRGPLRRSCGRSPDELGPCAGCEKRRCDDADGA